MLTDGHLRVLVDYTKMSTAFPGVDFEGGVGYFLWDRETSGDCLYTLIQGEEAQTPVVRKLDEFDIFVREIRAVQLLKKVRAMNEPTMSAIVSGDTPFGLPTNYSEFAAKRFPGALELHVSVRQKRVIGWVRDSSITKNRNLIPAWKLFLPKAYGERGAIPANVLGPSVVAGPNAVCTQTYVAVAPFDSQPAALSCDAYLKTRFARFLVSLRKITQDLPRATYSWLPQQAWDRAWDDEALYEKYGISTMRSPSSS